MEVIRKAKKSDLDAMIDLWAETIDWQPVNPISVRDEYMPKASDVVHLAEAWKGSIDLGTVMVSYKNQELMGFCVASPYVQNNGVPDRLMIHDVYVLPWIPENDLTEKLLIQMGKKAQKEGYRRMSIGISSTREDNLKEQCIRLGAMYTGIQGLNYSYIENYEWRDLSLFENR